MIKVPRAPFWFEVVLLVVATPPAYIASRSGFVISRDSLLLIE